MKQGMGQEQESALERGLTSLYGQKTPEGFETAWRAAIRREENLRMKPKTRVSFWKAALPAAAALTLVVGTILTGNLDLTGKTPSLEASRSSVQKQTAADFSAASNEAEWGAWNFDGKSASTGAVFMDAEPMAEMFVYGMNEGGGAGTGGASGVPAEETASKIIRTAQLHLATTNFDADEATLRRQTTAAGGYVEAVFQFGDGTRENLRRLTLTLRIPAEQLDGFLTGAAAIGRVTSRVERAVDMTVQYADTALRLKTQQGKMERLQALLLQAENVSDLLEIENEISNTQYMLDSFESSLRGIDRQVERSEVNVVLAEETPADSAAAVGISLGQRMGNAFTASLSGIARFFQNMAVFLVMAAPAIALLAAGSVLWLLHRRKRKQKFTSKEN